jgi:hypothetical protein
MGEGGGLPVVGGGGGGEIRQSGSLMTHSAGSANTQSIVFKYVIASEPYRYT